MDRVIPVINCPQGDTACIQGKLDTLRPFCRQVHLDVADGSFTPTQSGITPAVWKMIGQEFQLEVHLMVDNPEAVLGEWLEVGAKRVIVHIETLESEGIEKHVQNIHTRCQASGAVLVLAARLETEATSLTRHAHQTNEFCVLAVNPGPPGQPLHPEAFNLIRALHKALPQARIEVDGGINPQTARQVREAGAHAVCAGTYIFSHADPQAAFAALQNELQLEA